MSMVPISQAGGRCPADGSGRTVRERASTHPRDRCLAPERVYALLFARQPLQQEIQVGLSLLAQSPARNGSGRASGASLAAWEEYCQVLLCLNEFVYVD